MRVVWSDRVSPGKRSMLLVSYRAVVGSSFVWPDVGRVGVVDMVAVDMRTEASLDTYETPAWLVAEVKAFFGGSIDLDPCTSRRNPVGAHMYLTHGGLESFWSVRADTAYVNSPYGRVLKDWTAKCIEESADGCEIVQLAPARFGAGWFKTLAGGAACFGVFNRRLAFTLAGKPVVDKKGRPTTAQFDAVLAYHGPRIEEFRKHFAPHLTFWQLVQ